MARPRIFVTRFPKPSGAVHCSFLDKGDGSLLITLTDSMAMCAPSQSRTLDRAKYEASEKHGVADAAVICETARGDS